MKRIIAGLLVLGCGASAGAAVTITDLPFYATAVTADGQTVFGVSASRELMRWSAADGISTLGTFGGTAHVWGVSDDGTTLTGQALDTGTVTNKPFRWTQAGGIEFLPVSGGSGNWISGDGQTIVGSGSPSLGFKWTENGGATPLNFLARSASYDGSVIVGLAPGSPAVRQTPSGTETLQLTGSTYARVVTPDGKITAGTSGDGPFIWHEDGTVDMITPTTYPWFETDISADGSTLVGIPNNFALGMGTIYHDGTTEKLRDYLIGLGADVGTRGFDYAWAISDDGRTIVGYGGPAQGFVVTVPEPATGLAAAIGSLALVRRRRAALR